MAQPEDSAALLRIYGQYIGTNVTFETVLPTQAEFARRIREVSKVYPYLIWEENGVPLGYAYAHRWKERAAYAWDVELSVYVDGAAQRRGVGRRLYAVLLRLLAMQGVRMAYAVVVVPNPASESLHRAFGFERIALGRDTGFKNGVWLTTATYQKELLPHDGPPEPVTPVDRLGDIEALLNS